MRQEPTAVESALKIVICHTVHSGVCDMLSFSSLRLKFLFTYKTQWLFTAFYVTGSEGKKTNTVIGRNLGTDPEHLMMGVVEKVRQPPE